MGVLFTLLVLLGFVFHFLGTWPVPYAQRVAWGLWVAAAVLWVLTQL